MKRYSKPILAIVLIVILAFLFLVRQVGANPLVADANESLVLSGTLEARQTRLASEVGARVKTVRVGKGDAVKAGDILVELDDSTVRTNLNEAESAVRAAQANLDQVKEPARPGTLAVAEAALAAAQADQAAAQRALDDANRAVQTPQEIQTQIDMWQGKVSASKGQVAQAQAGLASMNSQVELARRDQSSSGKVRLTAMEKQQQAAETTLAASQADLAANQKVRDLYRQMLTTPLELTAAQHAAGGQLKIADAGLQVAQAELDIVRRGPQAEAVALAQAKLDAAQASLKLVQALAKRYTLTSPLDGIILDRSIDPGETTRPGNAVITIGQTNDLEMTLYVPIRDLKSVRVGQKASIRVPSIPGRSFNGQVDYISPQGEFKPANIYNSQERSEMVFAIRLKIANDSQSLKAGLPADASLQ